MNSRATGVTDSRRLTGPNLLLEGAGAVLDVRLPEAERPKIIAAWRGWARRLLEAVGWENEALAVREFSSGVSLAVSAPADALYAATHLNERAWALAEAELAGHPPADWSAEAAELRGIIASERNPGALALRDAARDRGVLFLRDDDCVSVGGGRGSLSWPAQQLPAPARVDWSRVHDIPVVLVTGSNGKTTVVRLLSAMASAAGLVPGSTSTDGVVVAEETLLEGDYSGPTGARAVLRHPAVDIAILETARGGILRRGLAMDRANVAVITNIAADHLGEFGVENLRELAAAKLVVTRVVGPRGTVVLNADDPILAAAGDELDIPVTWFSLHPDQYRLRAHAAAGGTAVVAEAGSLIILTRGERTPVTGLADVPITVGGIARHNVANAMAATGAALGLGLPLEAVRRALQRFGLESRDNPGRANLFTMGGVRILIDYAHNPHGMAALVGMAESIPARRRLVLLGQAGDRSDGAIAELAATALRLRPDRVLLKDMDQYLRGRAPGEVPALMRAALEQRGVPADAISAHDSEEEAVRRALEWARPGDLLVLTVHQDRSRVLALLSVLSSEGWQAGEPLPDQRVSRTR